MLLRFFMLAVAFFLSCTEVERDNPFDSGGKNYMGDKLSSSSSVEEPEPFVCNNVGNYSCDMSGYKTVEINGQVWMAENMNCDVEGSYCYNNNTKNCDKYGRLYDWCTAMEVCQNGWHLPSNDEWQELLTFAGGNLIAGRYLKAKDGWSDCEGKSGNGEDKFGFAALPGGYGLGNGKFTSLSGNGFWWSSTDMEYPADEYAYLRDMDCYSESVSGSTGINYKTIMYSVRCIKDQLSEPKLPE